MNRSFSAMPFAVGLLLFMIALGLLALPFDPGFLAVANAAVPAAGASSAAAPQLPASEAIHQMVNLSLPLWSVIPFVALLLSVALVPLVNGLWWKKNEKWVALFWSASFLVPFSYFYGWQEGLYRFLEAVLLDFIPFIILLYGLFATAGGIVVNGRLEGTPKMNALILLVGTLLASWIGTTGAAMLLIRPLIRINAWRKHASHIMVFLILLVANMGGCLTPLGDPPLFMGFQRGVPFGWTFQLTPILLVNMAILFAAFYLMDTYYFKKELAAGRQPEEIQAEEGTPLIHIDGKRNFIYIGIIIVGVIANGFLPEYVPFFMNGVGITVFDDIVFPYATVVEIALILLASFLSLHTTPERIRKANSFSMAPMIGVAILFIGIFITMIPALVLLKVHGTELGIDQPWQMFWVCGLLSSCLDNTPTYLVFLQTAASLGAAEGIATTVGTVTPLMLEAISAGAVFMGAMTYIGNAPNFMIKAIAEESGIKMPGFFAYIGWAIVILCPVFIIDTLVFYI